MKSFIISLLVLLSFNVNAQTFGTNVIMIYDKGDTRAKVDTNTFTIVGDTINMGGLVYQIKDTIFVDSSCGIEAVRLKLSDSDSVTYVVELTKENQEYTGVSFIMSEGKFVAYVAAIKPSAFPQDEFGKIDIK